MPQVGAIPAKLSMAWLVRDKDGKPKIDDPENIPAELFNLLTPAEQEAFKNGNNAHNSNT